MTELHDLLNRLGKPEATIDKPINECIWYQNETMANKNNLPCMTCGGYKLECAETGRYMPREDKMKMQEFVNSFIKKWNSKYDRNSRR